MLQKGIRYFLLAWVALFVLTGCSPIINELPDTVDIYATTYPLYALTQRISEGASNTDIHCLVQPQDGCLRSYSLSDWDLYMLAYSADIVISGGNGLESFQDQLRTMGETTLPLAEVLTGVPMEQIDVAAHDDDSHFSGEIPHSYLSMTQATTIVDNIAGALSILDENNAEIYETNRQAVRSEIDQLSSAIAEQTKVCTNVRAAILHEALIYPAKECGLDIVAAVERESGEMLYANSLTECLNTLDQHDLRLVLLEKQAPLALIETLIDAGYSVVQLDVLSTHQEKDGFEGYIHALAANAKQIIDACIEETSP